MKKAKRARTVTIVLDRSLCEHVRSLCPPYIRTRSAAVAHFLTTALTSTAANAKTAEAAQSDEEDGAATQ